MDGIVTPDPTTPKSDRQAAGLVVALVGALAAIAVGVTAITTSGDSSAPKPNPTTGQVSAPAPSTTAPVRRSAAVAPATPGPGASRPVPVLLRYGAQEGRAQIPWSQVGRGWFLAEPYNATSGAGKGLYLVNPIGGRYLITDHLPHTGDGIAAWSPDGARVMLSRQEASGHMVFTELELATGQVLHTFGANQWASFISYTRPQGRAILMYHADRRPSSLERLSTDGRHQLSYPDTLPGLGKVAAGRRSIYTADGAQLLVGAANGIALLENDGHLIRPLPAPPGQKSCMPLAWWDAATALVSCTNEAVQSKLYGSPTELFLQPVTGGSPAKLAGGSTEAHSFGFVYAWKYSDGVVLREGSGCGPGPLDVLRTGVIRRLTLPAGAEDSPPVVGMDGDVITLRRLAGCTGSPKNSVISFNLRTGATTTLFTGSVLMILYPQP
jgi:hypothetical protein